MLFFNIEAISTPLPSQGKRLSYDFTVSMLFSNMYVTYVMPVPHVMSVTSVTYVMYITNN